MGRPLWLQNLILEAHGDLVDGEPLGPGSRVSLAEHVPPEREAQARLAKSAPAVAISAEHSQISSVAQPDIFRARIHLRRLPGRPPRWALRCHNPAPDLGERSRIDKSSQKCDLPTTITGWVETRNIVSAPAGLFKRAECLERWPLRLRRNRECNH